MRRTKGVTGALVARLVLTQNALADEQSPGQVVLIKLNAAKSIAESCTLTFLVLNEHANAIENAVYETVLFDSSGQVNRLTLFDFGTLPPGRPRVRQLSVPGVSPTKCSGVGRAMCLGWRASVLHY